MKDVKSSHTQKGSGSGRVTPPPYMQGSLVDPWRLRTEAFHTAALTLTPCQHHQREQVQ